VAAAGLALIAADVALAIAERARGAAARRRR
jgi:hypothetical protein